MKPGTGRTQTAHSFGKAHLFIVSLALLSAWMLSGRICLANQVVSMPLKFDEPIINVEEGISRVTIEGLKSYGAPGSPVLPYRTGKVLLPYGTRKVSVDVAAGRKTTLSGSHRIVHGQQPVPLSFDGPIVLTPPDEAVYSSIEPFPASMYSHASVQYKRGFAVLTLLINPVEYIPASGRISYYESMTVTVTVEAAGRDLANPLFRGLSKDYSAISGLIDNPAILETYPLSRAIDRSAGSGRLDSDPPYDYVIITNEALENAAGDYTFQDLADAKEAKGLSTTIVTTEFIYANYDGTRPDGGDDDQTRIRNFITDAYLTWGTQYVLLGGVLERLVRDDH
ncbi:C25 family cysteine peptidase, partial [Thermodesulfobacteriota bacterium]